MKRASPEHDLQRAVVDLLIKTAPPDAAWTAINPKPQKGAAQGAQMKRLGLAAGIPDIIIIRNGFTLWIELKAPGGTLSDAQKEMHRRLIQAHSVPVGPYTRSGTVVVCKSIDEVRMALASHRMTREKAAA